MQFIEAAKLQECAKFYQNITLMKTTSSNMIPHSTRIATVNLLSQLWFPQTYSCSNDFWCASYCPECATDAYCASCSCLTSLACRDKCDRCKGIWYFARKGCKKRLSMVFYQIMRICYIFFISPSVPTNCLCSFWGSSTGILEHRKSMFCNILLLSHRKYQS